MSEIQKQNESKKQYLSLIARLYVLFILVVYPLYVGPDGYNDIVWRKAQLYWFVTLTFFVIFGLFYIVYVMKTRNNYLNFKFWKSFNIADWAVVAFFFIITLSCILSPYQKIVWLGFTNRNDGWLTMFCVVFCYFILSRWYRPNQKDFAIFAIGSGILCIIGFLQFYGYDFMNLFPYTGQAYIDINGNPIYSGFSISYRSSIGNIDFLSCYVCMTITVFATLYTKTRGPLRFLYLVVSTMNFAFMIIGGADAGKVGLLGALLLLVPYWMANKNTIGRIVLQSSAWGFSYCIHHWIILNKVMPEWGVERPVADGLLKLNYSTLPLKTILLLSIMALIVGIIFLHIKMPYPKLKTNQIFGTIIMITVILGVVSGVEIVGKHLPEENKIYQAREIMHGNLEDHFGSGRGFIWKRAIPQVLKSPILGTGADTFIEAFGENNQEESKEKFDTIFDKAHNDFIQILLCYGFVGLVAYLVIICSTIVLSIRKAFYDDFLIVAIGAVLAYLIQSFFGIDTLIVTPIYWLMLSLVRQRQLETVTSIPN